MAVGARSRPSRICLSRRDPRARERLESSARGVWRERTVARAKRARERLCARELTHRQRDVFGQRPEIPGWERAPMAVGARSRPSRICLSRRDPRARERLESSARGVWRERTVARARRARERPCARDLTHRQRDVFGQRPEIPGWERAPMAVGARSRPSRIEIVLPSAPATDARIDARAQAQIDAWVDTRTMKGRGPVVVMPPARGREESPSSFPGAAPLAKCGTS